MKRRKLLSLAAYKRFLSQLQVAYTSAFYQTHSIPSVSRTLPPTMSGKDESDSSHDMPLSISATSMTAVQAGANTFHISARASDSPASWPVSHGGLATPMADLLLPSMASLLTMVRQSGLQPLQSFSTRVLYRAFATSSRYRPAA